MTADVNLHLRILQWPETAPWKILLDGNPGTSDRGPGRTSRQYGLARVPRTLDVPPMLLARADEVIE